MSSECRHCGASLRGSPRFCPECGTQLDSQRATVPASPPNQSNSATSSSRTEGRFVAGQRLGERYRIVQRLGQGAMGEVYRADDLELGQSVALKLLPTRLQSDERSLDRLRTEVRLARSISHANVCRVYDIGQADGHVFVTMEYIDGEDLSDALRRMGRPSSEKAQELARQVCLGLSAAHEAGVIHRDLKPSNIMIDGRGRARITDFGLASLVEDLEETKELAGTPAYMAPEQLASGQVSIQSDIYSLGLVLHELFTGRRVFDSDSLEARRAAVDTGSSTSTSLLEAQPVIARAIERCLESEPSARPRSVYDVLAALPGGDPLAAALAAGETPSPELVASVRDARAVRPHLVVVLAACILVSLVASALISGCITRFPVRPSAELRFLAKEIATHDLGLTELPGFSAFSVEPLYPEAREHVDGAFAFWQRWSPVRLEANFHAPWYVQLHEPPHTVPGSVAVVLDDTGSLLQASVIVAPHPHDPTAEPDLSPLLARSGLDPAKVRPERVSPAVNDPPLDVYCDHVTVWYDKESDQPVASAGVYAGQIVAFERTGATLATLPSEIEPNAGNAGWLSLLQPLIQVGFLVVLIAAVVNLRLGRGDRRGALRTALVIGLAYLGLELLAFDRGQDLMPQFADLLFGRAAGHAALHMVTTAIIYLAFEPIARRVWPRVLVGWVRLVDIRLRDTKVGLEILIGLTAGTLVALARCVGTAWFGNDSAPLTRALGALDGTWGMAHSTVFAIAGGLHFCMITIMTVGFGYLALRFRAAAFVVGLGGLTSQLTQLGGPFEVTFLASAVAIVLFFRVGLLATYAFFGVFIFLHADGLTTDLSQWYASYTIFAFLVLLSMAGYSAWSILSSTGTRPR